MPNRYRGFPRRQLFQRALLAVPIFAFIIGTLPVLAVLIFGAGSGSTPTAYASAPPGTYVVAALAGADEDTIFVVSTTDPTIQFQVAGVPHAREVSTMGSVSPNGELLALIVVDPGARSEAVASLKLVELGSGDVTTLISSIDGLQQPVWTDDSANIVVVRSRRGTDIGVNVDLIQAAVTGGEHVLWTVENTIAAYPVGFNAAGELVAVRIDGSGTSAVIANAEPIPMTQYFSRDWELNGDGSAIAFIENNLDAGLKFVPRIVSLGSESGSVIAQSVGAGEALGTAWAPTSPTATFGHQPVADGSGSVSAQSLSGGFVVPLSYSPSGAELAAWHWSGNSFADPGQASLVVDSLEGRVTLTGMSRFFGWAGR